MATEYSGYMGKILHVDLTAETAKEYPWSDEQRRQTLGGKAAAMEILSKHLTGREQPFSEKNRIIFSTGPLTGTGAPGSDRFEITTLSPKTGTVASSNCGGKFGVGLKKAGLDGLILSGRCTKPSWLEINETGVFFHDAKSLWGLSTTQCTQGLDALLSVKASVCIGPAGEDLLPCATIVSQGRSAGGSGMGAVLGWKGIKAITLSGNRRIPVQNPEAVGSFLRQWNHAIAGNPFTADPNKISSCPGCPIRCKKPETPPEPWLKELGLDALEANRFRPWLEKQGIFLPEKLQKSEYGKRRNQLYQQLLSQWNLPQEETSWQLYKALTETLSAMGLCMFAAGTGILSATLKNPEDSPINLAALLLHTTGISLSREQLLAVGRNSIHLQKSLQNLYLKADP